MTTTIYTVTSAAQLATDIAAIDAASQADAGSGASFEIEIATGVTLSETAALPAISLDGSDTLTIQGNGSTLNGNAQFSGLSVNSGAVTIDNLTIENAVALGSNASGFGVGGGLFVGQGTTVTLNNVSFADDAATGGTYYNPTGGVALGGDIFVNQNGTLTIDGGVIGVGSVTGGGGDAGDGIYIESTQAIMLAPAAGQVTTVYGVIADENALDGSINAGSLIVDGAGTVLLNPEVSPTDTASTPNTFAGGVHLLSGTLELASARAAGTGTIVFGAPATGNPSPILKLDPAAFANGSFANAVTNFNIGDTIDLAGLSTQSVSYSSQTDTLTVGGDTINLSVVYQLESATLSFATSSDGNGGTDVMLNIAPPVVTITSPAESSANASQTVTGSVTSSSGAIVAGETATLTDNGVVLGTTLVANNGTFTFNVTLPNQGSNSLVASVTDSFGNTGSSAAVVDQLGGIAPSIAGGKAGVQATTNNAPISPFVGVTITDVNAGATDTVTVAFSAANGTLSDPNAATDGSHIGSGSYSVTGTAAQVTADLDALSFTPTAGAPNTSTTTSFTITDTSSASPTATVDPNPITVTNNDAAALPTITGTKAGQTTTNGAALDPFANVVVADQNAAATETLFITLSGPGTLKDGAGFSGLGTSGAASGVYVLQGSAGTVTKELDALVFTPAAAAANSSTETTFTLEDISSASTLTTNNVTTVTNSDAAVASVISGTVGGQVVGIDKTINLFAHAVISDANANSTDTVYVDVSSGTLRDGAGFSGLTASSVAGLYSISAQSAAQATAEVDALVYTPAQTGSRSATPVSVQFVVQNSAGIVTSNSTTSLTVDPGPATGAVSETVVDGTGINLTSAVLAAAKAGLTGDQLTITAVNGSATLGNFSLVNGQLTYAASTSALSHIVANGSATDTLGYTISDQYGDTATGTVAITVTNPASETITAGYLLGIPVGLATVYGNGGPDVINAGGLLNTIYANGGNDLITAGSGLDTVYAGAGSDAITLAGSSNTVSGGDGWDTVTGSTGSTTISLGNGNDKISASGIFNTITLGSGNNSISGGQGLETIVVGAGTDAISIGGTSNNVTLNGSQASVAGGQGGDTITVNGGSDNLTFAGGSDTAAINGIAKVNISDLGSALTTKIGSSTQTDTITGLGTSDPYGVIDLLNGAGGYASTAQILSNLHSDGHGGTLLALGTQGSVDFVGTSISQLHASNFKIG